MKYLIVGGGIAGLTTALALEQKGIEYEVYERVTSYKMIGAGIWLAPNALQVLESLELIDKVKTQGNQIKRITLGRKDLRPITDTPQERYITQYGYGTIAIHRAKLLKLLADKIPSHKLHLGKSLSQIQQNDQGEVNLTFEDGTIATGNAIIGADGIKSKVRQHIFPQSLIRYSGQSCWRGIANHKIDPAFKSKGLELWGDGVRFGFSSIGPSMVYWFAVAKSKRNQQDKAGTAKAILLDRYAQFDPMVNTIIKSTDENKIMRNDIDDLKPMKDWYKHNICLIGDAGHATTPNMGQGGGQAIEDAYYLSRTIANNPKSAFSTFQAQRQKKVNGIVNQSWMFGKLAHLKFGSGLRNFVLSNAPASMMNKTMDELYRLV